MRLIRSLVRLLILIAGAFIGLALFLFAVAAFAVVLVISLLRGRKPNMQFRMNKNPWAPRRATQAEDVVDIDAREIKDPVPLPLQPPRR